MYCVTVDCTEYRNVGFLVAENILLNFIEGSLFEVSLHGIGCVFVTGWGMNESCFDYWRGYEILLFCQHVDLFCGPLGFVLSSNGGKQGWVVKLTTGCHLVLWFRMSGAVPLLSHVL